MILTYQDTSSSTRSIGQYMDIYFYHRKRRNTGIIYELYYIIKDNKDKSFDEIYDIIMEAYKNKNSRSVCDIYKDSKTIQICNKGVFPNILISKII